MDERMNMPFFSEKLCSAVLVSNNLCYGPRPRSDEIVEQHLSIHADGRVWLSLYRFGDGIDYQRTETRRLKLPLEQTGHILSLIRSYFETPHMEEFATDVGDWNIRLKNEAGETFTRRGPLIPSADELSVISEAVRAALDMPDVFCFDGVFEK